MTTLMYKGVEYIIRYKHERNIVDSKISTRGGITIASIVDELGYPLQTGMAYCSEKDVYRKKLGRIISTGRLLKSLGIPRHNISSY